MTKSAADKISAFRERRLRSTIENAAKVPFYRDLWRDVDHTSIETAADLAVLPLVDKPMYEAGLFREEWSDPEPPVVVYTSGTTGPRTPRLRSRADAAVFADFVNTITERDLNDAAPPLILDFVGIYPHGSKISLGAASPVLSGSTSEWVWLRLALNYLRESFAYPVSNARVSEIWGLPRDLFLVTLACLRTGLDPSTTAVRRLCSVGGYTSAFTISFLKRAWPNATIVDRFSMSEITGGATRCRDCGLFHLDPVVIGEVIDVNTAMPVEHGDGLLVLTELHPFVTVQPLIRYQTGDLVRREPTPSCRFGTWGFAYLGREKHAVFAEKDGKRELLIRPALLVDALEASPDVERERMTGLPELDDPPYGPAVGGIERKLDENLLRLELGTRFPPEVYAERAQRLIDDVRSRVLADNPELQTAVSSGVLTFDVRLRQARRGERGAL